MISITNGFGTVASSETAAPIIKGPIKLIKLDTGTKVIKL